MSKYISDKIKEIEKANRLIDNNLVDAIWVVDVETLKYDYITPSIEKLSGYTAEELVNTNIITRMSPDSITKTHQILQESLKSVDEGNEINYVLELEMQHKNQSTYWVEVRASFVKDQDDSLKIIGISKDITQKKTFETEQQNLIGKLKKALEEKDKLIKEVQMLSKLLPICSGCRRIRGEDGKWWPLDAYVQHNMGSDFTHTICNDCRGVFYPDL